MTPIRSFLRLFSFAFVLISAFNIVRLTLLSEAAEAAIVPASENATLPKCDSSLSRLMVVAELLRPLDTSSKLSALEAATFVDLAKKFIKIGAIASKGQRMGRQQCSMDISISDDALKALRHSGTAMTYAAFSGRAFKNIAVRIGYETGFANGEPFVHLIDSSPKEAIVQLGWQWRAYRNMARAH